MLATACKQVRPGDDSLQGVAVHHGKPLDALLLHQSDEIFKRGFFVHRNRILSHDVLDLASAFVDEIRSRSAGADEELQPSRPLASSADFAAAEEIAFRDDADQLARVVQYGQAADVGPKHDPGCILDRGVRRDGNDILGHDVVSAHGVSPLNSIFSA